MCPAGEILDQEVVEGAQDDQAQHQKQINVVGSGTSGTNSVLGECAICLDSIKLTEMALVKGCEHAYCVKCILRWASYSERPTCPKCKAPFEFLIVHRTLDGRVYDYLFEESVFLLLRASWFKPRVVVEREKVDEDFDDLYDEDEVEDLTEVYLRSSKGLRIGNRRWRDDGYFRVGEARPVGRLHIQDSSVGPSRQLKKKEPVVRETISQREKRSLKREAAAAAKHQRHLARLGRT